MSFDGRLLSGIGVMAAVAEAGSFVHAAKSLGLTQSGVSRSIGRLETRVGIRLFDRTARAVRLTDDGRRFYEQVRPLLSGLEEAVSLAEGSTTSVRGRLRVNIDPFFSRLVLARNLNTFLSGNPALELELVARDYLGDLVTEGFDVAVRFGEPADSALIARRLIDIRILTVASPEYLAIHGRPSDPIELKQHQAIHFIDSRTSRPFIWEFHKGKTVLPVQPPGRLTVTEVGTMLSACVSGVGIAQILDFGVRDLIESGRLVELFPDWPDERYPLYAYHPSRNLPPAKVRIFLEFVLNAAHAAIRVEGLHLPRVEPT
ncbi:LysR family transcriptional regulator [Bradyrhizobium sp. 187]|uniref:LysR family transcriptional regulator n=1 Tax=Bradyrhizobium sp. 187 TaxID=2782655 RepID=UPI001FFF926A|nr:LysR family transcriptional regulator [Bradyrhizobium sp. 187]UPJ71854.1 LysR family transcriptional regulator [Bradyrhizobium sp. 187]